MSICCVYNYILLSKTDGKTTKVFSHIHTLLYISRITYRGKNKHRYTYICTKTLTYIASNSLNIVIIFVNLFSSLITTPTTIKSTLPTYYLSYILNMFVCLCGSSRGLFGALLEYVCLQLIWTKTGYCFLFNITKVLHFKTVDIIYIYDCS